MHNIKIPESSSAGDNIVYLGTPVMSCVLSGESQVTEGLNGGGGGKFIMERGELVAFVCCTKIL